MKKSGGFRIKEHLCNWTNQGKYFSLHVWLYADGIGAHEEPCADQYFEGRTIREASTRFKTWLRKADLSDIKDERGVAE